MAALNLESMVLHSQAAGERVVAGVVRMGSVKVDGRTPAHLSYPRHTSHPHTDPTRSNRVVNDDAADAALRAGRPAGSAGVLACAARLERPETLGEPSPVMAAMFMAMPSAEQFSELPGQRWLRPALWAKQQRLAKRGWRKPAAGAPAVSTRGQKPGRSASPTRRTSESAIYDRGHASR